MKAKKKVKNWNVIKVAFDVDQTLVVDSEDGLIIPNYEMVSLFKIFDRMGCEMYIWSGCGIEYAKRWRDKLGLFAKVVEKGSFKPEIAIDDMEDMMLGIVNLVV